jgi:hypothetical protein
MYEVYTHKTNYFMQDLSLRRMRWAGHVARIGEEEEFIQGFGGIARRKETAR